MLGGSPVESRRALDASTRRSWRATSTAKLRWLWIDFAEDRLMPIIIRWIRRVIASAAIVGTLTPKLFGFTVGACGLSMYVCPEQF